MIVALNRPVFSLQSMLVLLASEEHSTWASWRQPQDMPVLAGFAPRKTSVRAPGHSAGAKPSAAATWRSFFRSLNGFGGLSWPWHKASSNAWARLAKPAWHKRLHTKVDKHYALPHFSFKKHPQGPGWQYASAQALETMPYCKIKSSRPQLGNKPEFTDSTDTSTGPCTFGKVVPWVFGCFWSIITSKKWTSFWTSCMASVAASASNTGNSMHQTIS